MPPPGRATVRYGGTGTLTAVTTPTGELAGLNLLTGTRLVSSGGMVKCEGVIILMKIYISASWKKREEVRTLANKLREFGHEVFDFTDRKCRNVPEIPPEKFPEQFDPEKHDYHDYLDRPEFRFAMRENYQAIAWSDLIILILPCGLDATADWALGVGFGKPSIIVGNPGAGVRCPTHLWADVITESIDDVVQRLNPSPLRANPVCKTPEVRRLEAMALKHIMTNF